MVKIWYLDSPNKEELNIQQVELQTGMKILHVGNNLFYFPYNGNYYLPLQSFLAFFSGTKKNVVHFQFTDEELNDQKFIEKLKKDNGVLFEGDNEISKTRADFKERVRYAFFFTINITSI